uniref:Protein S100 n=1 Tax=Sander lucioperca TaxID=283035 RepID=A0A8C9XWD4_SANLU
MSELQTAMNTLLKVFHSYSGKEGDKFKLNKSELKKLLTTELEIVGKNGNVERLMQDLDLDKDGEVDFQEYVNFVATVTMMMDEFFQRNK